MNDIIDFHTHHNSASAALIAVDPRQFYPQQGLCYSVGFHPWNEVDSLNAEDFGRLAECALHPQVLAVGETGMDALRGAPLNIQANVFLRHLQVAASVGKPVVIHSVRTAQEILAVRRKSGLVGVPLAVHGMRSNANVARLWLDAGCYLSFGARFNPAALIATPIDRLLIETDDAPESIEAVAASVASTLGLTADEFLSCVTATASCLLSHPCG